MKITDKETKECYDYTLLRRVPYKCPVCEGKGVVPAGFYESCGGYLTNISSITCQSCDGTGIVWG